ncbi:hypothetical protein BMF94_7114, partial [Rhodotorula taiwanensis]
MEIRGAPSRAEGRVATAWDFRFLFNLLQTQIQVIGFANALGSTYLLYFATVYVALFVVSPPPAQVSLTLHLVVIQCLLEIFDSERD